MCASAQAASQHTNTVQSATPHSCFKFLLHVNIAVPTSWVPAQHEHADVAPVTQNMLHSCMQLDDIEALNYDDLSVVAKLSGSAAYKDIMEVCSWDACHVVRILQSRTMCTVC